METIKSLFFFFIGIFSVNCQTCLYKNLSQNFDFRIELERINDNNCEISVFIINKENLEKIQTIKFNSEFMFEKDFKDCSTIKSYSTGVNENLIITDNDFGDFIVGDFNFDEKDDFAIKKDSGGNGGPIYLFYIQNNNSKFDLDIYLTNTVEFFPSKINKPRKTLTTLVHANAYERCKKSFKYNSKTKKWKEISKTFVEY